MSRTLARVARATARRDQVCADSFAAYVDALRAARAAGHTLEDIGKAAGITKNGVRYLLIGDTRQAKR
jgi:hypothetical protein